MILGALYWNDRTRYSVQTNNPTEEQLRKAGIKNWLETCGPTTAINCLGALGVNLSVVCPGPYRPQPEEVLADYLNDPANYDKLRAARPDVDPTKMQGNRVPQDYPTAVRDVFGAAGEFVMGIGWAGVVAHVTEGRAVQICWKNPGHYLAVVAYEEANDELIYHDSWPARIGGDGFARRMGKAEYDGNIQPFVIVYRNA